MEVMIGIPLLCSSEEEDTGERIWPLTSLRYMWLMSSDAAYGAEADNSNRWDKCPVGWKDLVIPTPLLCEGHSALRMMKDTEKGMTTPDITTLIEPTSENLGIGLAFVSGGKNIVAVMPAHFSLDGWIVEIFGF